MAKKPPAVLTVVEERKTLKQIVMDKLRNAILDLHFKPGQRLVERELCEMMGVSRTAVREALSFLSAEGLVTMVRKLNFCGCYKRVRWSGWVTIGSEKSMCVWWPPPT